MTIQIVQVTQAFPVHQGKYGFYPCSYETYKKLKEINKLLTRAIRQEATYFRWLRKAPQNRFNRRITRNEKGQIIKREKTDIPILEPKVDHSVLLLRGYDIRESYIRSRYPQPSAKEVRPLILNEKEIDLFYELIK